jgi:isoleucyl-tRNA synthetase
LEGIARDLIRTIQDLRKEADFNVTDRITVGIMSDDLEVKKALKKFEKHIAKETLAGSVVNKNVDSTHEKVCKVDDNAVTITIKKSSE